MRCTCSMYVTECPCRDFPGYCRRLCGGKFFTVLKIDVWWEFLHNAEDGCVMESSVCFQALCLASPVPDGQEIVLHSLESLGNQSVTPQLGLLKERQCYIIQGPPLPTHPQATCHCLEFFCASFVMQHLLHLRGWNHTQTSLTWRNTRMPVLFVTKGLPWKSTTMIIWACITKSKHTNVQTVSDCLHLKPASGNTYETEYAVKNNCRECLQKTNKQKLMLSGLQNNARFCIYGLSLWVTSVSGRSVSICASVW